MKYNDIIIKGTDRRRVRGVCDEVVFVSEINDYITMFSAETVEDLLADGWTVEEPEWVPEIGKTVFLFNSQGEILEQTWLASNKQKNKQAFGGAYRTRAEAEAMRDKLLAVVKENKV